MSSQFGSKQESHFALQEWRVCEALSGVRLDGQVIGNGFGLQTATDLGCDTWTSRDKKELILAMERGLRAS